MIATTPLASQLHEPETAASWQQVMANAITDPAELIERLRLDRSLLPAALRAAQTFGLRVPRGFLARMRPGDPTDPLLRQVLPLEEELQSAPGFTTDPVGDLASRTAGGVLHKYRGRALLIATGSCAIHCRYCFRRHFPYADHTASADRWRAALDYLRADPNLSEAILSGGDPLNLSERRLAELTDGIATIPHLKRLRIHTRTAVVVPERIDPAFCRWLKGVRLQKVMVLHVNHAQEIDAAVRATCERLRAAGATLLNQTVLLKGVNDTATALADLSESLFAAGVLPYYLNVLDRVAGAAHFEVPEERALELLRELTVRLPGYLVPKLVREEAGAHSKTSISFFA